MLATPKLYSLVEPYLIDIFRHAVNLVGARHREIFSQDHKRFFFLQTCIRLKMR